MDYVYFTDTKYNKLIESFDWSNEDKSYYDLLCLKDSPIEYVIPRDVKIYFYRCKINYIYPRSKKFKVIYEDNGKYYQLILYKLRKYITKRKFKELKDHHKPMVINMYNKGKENIDWSENHEYIYVYINVTINQLTNIEFLKAYPLYERIDTDISFDVYNSEDIENIYGKKDLELLNFDKQYDHLDFENIINHNTQKFTFEIDEYSNYIIDIEYFIDINTKLIYSNDSFNQSEKEEGFKINDVSIKCNTLLYQKYYGTNYGWYGYSDYKFDNYLVLVKVNIKNKIRYMYIHYCVDNASCGGMIFKLCTKSSCSKSKLWNQLNDTEKCVILKANLPSLRNNVLIIDARSESEPESDFNSD